MSEIKGKICDFCGKREIDIENIKQDWIQIASIYNDSGETTQIFYPDHSIVLEDSDFCSEECFIAFIHGDKNVIK
jgi:hypothetical protein